MSPPPTPRSTARPAAANAAGAPPLDSRATPIFEAIFDSDYIPPPASVDSRQPSLPARQANFPEPSQANTLEELAAFTLNCQRCHLAQPSKTLGQGPLNPPITLVLNSTEGDHLWPTGAAGKLLTEIITDGLNLAVEEVYVTRILKCRVKNLANLKPLEQKKCFELITREIILVNPQIVIALGEFPGQVLTQSNKSMFFLRIKPFFVLNSPQRIPLQIIYDLGPTLESLEVKKDMWRDLEKAKRLANLI
jgi:DNA polymerase